MDEDKLEPTVSEALRGMIRTAVLAGYVTGDGNRVMLSLDLLSQLALVDAEIEQRLLRAQAVNALEVVVRDWLLWKYDDTNNNGKGSLNSVIAAVEAFKKQA